MSVYLAVYTIHLSSPRLSFAATHARAVSAWSVVSSRPRRWKWGSARRLIVHGVKPILGVYDDDKFSYGLGIKVGHRGQRKQSPLPHQHSRAPEVHTAGDNTPVQQIVYAESLTTSGGRNA